VSVTKRRLGVKRGGEEVWGGEGGGGEGEEIRRWKKKQKKLKNLID